MIFFARYSFIFPFFSIDPVIKSGNEGPPILHYSEVFRYTVSSFIKNRSLLIFVTGYMKLFSAITEERLV